MKAFFIDRYSKKSPLRLGEMPEPELRDDDVLIEQQTKATRPPGRSARRIWPNAPVGSSKNITPKRENRMSNALWGSSALLASATRNRAGVSCGASARARQSAVRICPRPALGLPFRQTRRSVLHRADLRQPLRRRRRTRRRESVLSNQHRLLGEDTRHRALR